MKKILLFITALLICNYSFAAGGGDSGGSSNNSLYEDAVDFIKRAGKQEKKNNTEKAKKLYTKAFKKLENAYKSDKKIQIY